MKYYKLLSLLLAILASHAFVFGQTKSTSKAHLVRQFRNFENSDASLNHQNFFEKMAGRMQLSAASDMVLSETVEGANGFVHYKYRQFHDGVPVFGSTYILHESNGMVKTAGGQYSPLVGASAKPYFDANTALIKAKKAMAATEYAEKDPVPMLCYIDPAFPKTSENLVLAYQVDLYSLIPLNKQRLFLDAHSGKVICQFPLLLHEGVPSKAQTKYYGIRDIVTDSISPQQFILRDPTRGQGITVINSNGAPFFSTSANWNLTNDDQDEVALDAHFCSQEFYDLMLEQFSWDGLDDQGKALKVRVHDSGAGSVNAYWDGDATNYGDGNCLYGPLTTLEVVGHEFTHGVVDNTSNLVYASESGAINESLADIFGKILERNVDPGNFSWVVSHSFLLSPDAEPFRIMNDPASLDMPDYYKGSLWDDGADVHTNSSIGNLWFSMIVDGKQGINEAGISYNVPAIGVDKAGQIAFKVNTAYFTENSDYAQFAQFSLQAATELYGAGSVEALAVAEAWKAVGVTGAPPSQLLNLEVSSLGGFTQMCGLGTYLPVTFKVVNSGGIAYQASMGAIFKLYDDNGIFPEYTLPLTEPLAPGEAMEITVDDWFLPLNSDYYYISAELDFVDDNPSDNYTYMFTFVSENTANDLSFNAYLPSQKCFSSAKDVVLDIYNQSCNAIPSGTAVNILVEDDNGSILESFDYTFLSDLEAFNILTITEQLPTAIASEYLTFVLVYNGDVDDSNNNSFVANNTLIPIEGDYLYEFNDDYILDNSLEVNTYNAYPLVPYNGEQYFASTGLNSDPETFPHCPDYISSFNSNDLFSGVNSTLRTCVDFSASQTAFLDFDLVEFRNSYAASTNFDYSAMLQAKWKGTENGNEIVFGQTEGEEEHHSFQLPPNFKGEVIFKFYTEIGQWDADPMYFNQDDFVLMDNLQYKVNALKTTDVLPAQSVVAIAPNPTQGFATVTASGIMKTALLHNVSGQLLQELSIQSKSFDLNMTDWKSGFYFLTIELENGQQVVQKVVKME
jgi:Zn-dependent metalloprotease